MLSDLRAQSNVEGWTRSRYFQFIRAVLRRGFMKYPPKFRVLQDAKRKLPSKGVVYKCNACDKWFKKRDVTVDHVVQCGSLKSYDDLAGFVKRLFCTTEGLVVLCKPCHHNKTMKERGLTETDIKVAKFKRMKAAEQRATLTDNGLTPAKNAAGRIKQYQNMLEE